MRTILAGLVMLSSVAVWAADKLQPLNVKTGLWETTTTRITSGEIPIPAEMLARLTPEQRARMEARMKANSAEKTKTNTSKSCMTKEKLEKAPFSDEQKECTRTIVTSTSSKAEVRFTWRPSGHQGQWNNQCRGAQPRERQRLRERDHDRWRSHDDHEWNFHLQVARDRLWRRAVNCRRPT